MHCSGLASRRRFTIELLQLRRSREAVFFTIAFPVVMLALFGTIFGGQDLGPKSGGVTFAQYFIASMTGGRRLGLMLHEPGHLHPFRT